MEIVRGANLTLRFLLELCALAALGFWGATLSSGMPVRVAMAIALPLALAVFWGVFVSPKARIPTGRIGRAGFGWLVFVGTAALVANRGHSTLATTYAVVATVSSILSYALP